jgi:predicted amidohydrolase
MISKDLSIKIATCQHPITGDVRSNASWVRKQIRYAARQGADVVHFSETNLSGYAGGDLQEINYEDYPLLQKELLGIQNLAAQRKIWVIVGSHHFDPGMQKPYNSLYLISEMGEIAGRYDKRYLYGPEGEIEHAHYTPGLDKLEFELKGFKCGLLICHEWRYPELYREYHKSGVSIVFHSWYDGGLSREDFLSEGKELGELITGYVRGNAANNYLWISGSNNSRKESSFPAFMVQPDGKILGRLKRNKAGVIITQVRNSDSFEDPSAYNRKILFDRMDPHIKES